MPISYRAPSASSERFYNTLLDYTRRVMQIAALATAGLYAYVLYGLFGGGIDQWGTASHNDRLRILGNIEGAIFYLTISLGVLLVTMCILYYDEEAIGYILVATSVFFYYGIPFALDQGLPGETAKWSQTNNTAAGAVLTHFRIAAFMMALPGIVLLVRDIVLRLADGSRRKKDDNSAMQYGGGVSEQDTPKEASIGLFARCWQMAYCRDAIRKRCPIFHARTKCWRERVGCMCEENVIRKAMDAIINKEIITFEKKKEEPPKEVEPEIAGLTLDSAAKKEDAVEAGPEITVPMPKHEVIPHIRPKDVKIPYNTTLTMAQKKERCRNCIIYNEHQRLKYQFFAPLLLLAVPGLAVWKIEFLAGSLNSILHWADHLMYKLSLDPGTRSSGIASSITSNNMIAQYLIVGCIIVILTTMVLRSLEYVIFRLKI